MTRSDEERLTGYRSTPIEVEIEAPHLSLAEANDLAVRVKESKEFQRILAMVGEGAVAVGRVAVKILLASVMLLAFVGCATTTHNEAASASARGMEHCLVNVGRVFDAQQRAYGESEKRYIQRIFEGALRENSTDGKILVEKAIELFGSREKALAAVEAELTKTRGVIEAALSEGHDSIRLVKLLAESPAVDEAQMKTMVEMATMIAVRLLEERSRE